MYYVIVENCSFSAMHFIHSNSFSESIHGHNYLVKLTLGDEQLIDDMLLDFVQVEMLLKKIVNSLDHKLILAQNGDILYQKDQGNIKISYAHYNYSFPVESILFLPLSNISTELLARHMVEEIAKELDIPFIEIELQEYEGHKAIFRKEKYAI